jgi:hypothetical protein
MIALDIRADICFTQDTQSTYNLTLRSVRVTTVAVEKQYFLKILCVRVSVSVFLPLLSGMQSACAVSYCHLFPV